MSPGSTKRISEYCRRRDIKPMSLGFVLSDLFFDGI
jgi:hypothetical protein